MSSGRFVTPEIGLRLGFNVLEVVCALEEEKASLLVD